MDHVYCHSAENNTVFQARGNMTAAAAQIALTATATTTTTTTIPNNSAISANPINKQLKSMLLLHLDLIQEQSDMLVAKDKQIAALKQENDLLKTKVEHLEHRILIMPPQHSNQSQQAFAQQQPPEARRLNGNLSMQQSQPPPLLVPIPSKRSPKFTNQNNNNNNNINNNRPNSHSKSYSSGLQKSAHQQSTGLASPAPTPTTIISVTQNGFSIKTKSPELIASAPPPSLPASCPVSVNSVVARRTENSDANQQTTVVPEPQKHSPKSPISVPISDGPAPPQPLMQIKCEKQEFDQPVTYAASLPTILEIESSDEDNKPLVVKVEPLEHSVREDAEHKRVDNCDLERDQNKSDLPKHSLEDDAKVSSGGGDGGGPSVSFTAKPAKAHKRSVYNAARSSRNRKVARMMYTDKEYVTRHWEAEELEEDPNSLAVAELRRPIGGISVAGEEKPADSLEVPNWRVVSESEEDLVDEASVSGNALDEDLSAEAYLKRHAKYEIDERRRKKWDVQRIREQRNIERLKRRLCKSDLADGHHQGTSAEEQVPAHPASLYPSPSGIKFIETTEDLPIQAFGEPIPKFSSAEFRPNWRRPAPATVAPSAPCHQSPDVLPDAGAVVAAATMATAVELSPGEKVSTFAVRRLTQSGCGGGGGGGVSSSSSCGRPLKLKKTKIKKK